MAEPDARRDDPVDNERRLAEEARRAWIVLGAFGALVLLAWLLRGWLGIEWSAESVRGFVGRLGLLGPAIFILLLAFRIVIMVPTVVLLAAAGLCFGPLWGAAYGALGLTGAAALKWVLVRIAGPEAIQRQLLGGGGRGAIELTRSRAGKVALGVLSAYPVGPGALVQLAAAIAGMALVPYLAVVLAGSVVRASTFSLFGSAFVGENSFALSFALLAITFGVPLMIPRTRRWLVDAFRS
jgi:uncharacterized membrane protein YdjX (TVP38/TMEM64 family)